MQTQADFGPRVANTAAHKACGEFTAKLEEFGASILWRADLVAYDHTILKARNVIAPIIRKAKGVYCSVPIRTTLCRPGCRQRRSSPILGVNDGASGVGVLLKWPPTTAAGSSHRHRHHLL